MTQQIELFEIKTPCVGVCQFNKKGVCFGCLRTPKERQFWSKMTNEQRRRIIGLISARLQRLEKMRFRQKQQLVMNFGEDESGNLFE